jgi:hypothetical protein
MYNNTASDSSRSFLFRAKVRRQAANAWLIAPTDYRFPKCAAAWIPRSQLKVIEWEDANQRFTFEIPYALALRVFVS